MRPLANQSALVTGAGRGIGKAIALRLAAEGAHVALTARTLEQLQDTAAEIESQGGKAFAIAADVTDSEAVRRATTVAAERFGPVSILVNNAAIPGPFGPIGAVDPDEWWQSQKVHVLAPVLFMHHVIPGMRVRGGGRIINIVSSAGIQPVPHLSAYALGKHTAIRLSETVDLEQRSHGIRVFALHPGNITTDMARYTIASPEARRWVPEGVSMIASRTAEESQADLKRCMDVVAALSAGRHDALAGQYLDINWDLDAKARGA